MFPRRGCLLPVVATALGALVVPLLLPYPNQRKVASARALAKPESRFFRVNGLDVHLREAGGGETILILLHGLGAGVFGWEPVLPALAARYRVIAYDRPAFGLTERPMPDTWEGDSPYTPEAQVELLIGLMDALGAQRAVLVGHSAGGRVALDAALRHPERVEALVLVDPAVYRGGGAPAMLRPLLELPQARRLGPWLMRALQLAGDRFLENAWHDPTRIDAATRAAYRDLWRLPDAERALWELAIAMGLNRLPARLGQVRVRTLVITGTDDHIIPTVQSVRVAGEIPHAELVVIDDAGHVPQEEQSEVFVRAVVAFVGALER